MWKNLDNTQTKLLLVAIPLFIILAVMAGIIAFQLGQQSSTIEPTKAASPPTATSAAAVPQIVTNTPTNTPTPSPTLAPSSTPTLTPSPTPTPTPTPIVVITHIKELGRLETAEFAMRTIIDLENEPANLWQRLVGSDKLLLIAEGEVVAGFDLEKMTEDNIVAEGDRVEVTLPAPEILYSRIDNERTYVYERETGLLVKPDKTLESRARQLAEEALIKWAAERGIYDKAETAGRLRLENLLRSLGFTEIVIKIRRPLQ
jgi:hypothetical protein